MGLEYRTGSILRRWKRNWFALWLDGTLGYYHDETAQDEEDRVLIHFNVRDIKIGQECHGEPLSLCDYKLGPPTVSENTCHSQAFFAAFRGLPQTLLLGLYQIQFMWCKLRNEFLTEFLPCAEPGPYAGFIKVSQT